jgi:sugar/nucleoside kinase (ribokinase family)
VSQANGTVPPEDEAADVFLTGLLFFDLVFTGLPHGPTPGIEVWSKGIGSGPGGIANFAVTLARFGLRTSLSAAFGADFYGRYCWDALIEEGVDLGRSRQFPDWHTPVTASMAYEGDRALVTYGAPAPLDVDALIGQPPPSRAAIVHIGPEPVEWMRQAHAAGTRIFADVGWDPSERWTSDVLDQLARCHAFMPNAEEAMAYTRTSTPQAALSRLADVVPLAVVTCGAEGAMAIDNTTGEHAWAPGLDVDALDTTGAGDIFGASLVTGTLAGWPLVDRLRFANLAAALSVCQVGGAPAAPGWKGIAEWWSANGSIGDYAFLDKVIAEHIK